MTYSYNRAPFSKVKAQVSVASVWMNAINIMLSEIKDKSLQHVIPFTRGSEIDKTS